MKPAGHWGFRIARLTVIGSSPVPALGVLLYELLTGKTPLDSKELLRAGVDELFRRIREEDAVAPSKRISSLERDELKTLAQTRRIDPVHFPAIIRGDLDWIVMKAVEKDRTRRYDTCGALAADIQRHLKNEPVIAGPPSAVYRARKFFQRNRVAALASIAIVTSLVSGSIAATIGMVIALDAKEESEQARSQLASEVNAKETALQISERARREAEALTLRLRHMNYASELQGAARYLEEGAQPDLFFHSSQLDKCDQDLRGWEWQWLNHMYLSRDIEVVDVVHKGLIDRVAYTSDGRTAVCGARGGMIYFYDARSQRLIGDPMETWGSTFAVSPDGRRIATLSARDEDHVGIAIKEMDGRQSVATLPGHRKSQREAFETRAYHGHVTELKRITITCMEFSPDGKWLAVGTNDGELSLWDVENSSAMKVVSAHNDAVMNIAFSPNGERIGTASPEPGLGVKLWHATSLELLQDFQHEQGALAITFSRDGRTLVAGGLNGEVKSWDMSGQVEKVMDLQSWVWSH